MTTQSNNILKLKTDQKETKSDVKKSFLEKKLDALNEGKRIKIRTQKNGNGKNHIYLDYHVKNKRERQFLRIYIDDKKTPETIHLLREAMIHRDRKEVQLYGLNEVEEFRLNKEKYKADFIEYFEFLVIARKKKDKSWMHTFATLPLTFGVDIYTVSKRMGTRISELPRYMPSLLTKRGMKQLSCFHLFNLNAYSI